jgi:hypothetical protein
MGKWLLPMLLLAGCQVQGVPQSTGTPEDETLSLTLLFEVDGCKVYRFYDMGSHHIVTCPFSAAIVERRSCGKGCSREHAVYTVPTHPDRFKTAQ